MELITSIFKEKQFLYWRFDSLIPQQRKDYWQTFSHQKLFLDSLRENLGFFRYEDCYNFTKNEIIQYNGEELLDMYGHSIANMVMSIYKDDFKWSFYKFNMNFGYWTDPLNRKKFFDDLFVHLDFKVLQLLICST